MGEHKANYVYCIVKSAVVRKKDGAEICRIPFTNQFKVIEELDGQYYGEAYRPEGNNSSIKIRGYVNKRGFVPYKITDMANLQYRNKTGQRIPTTLRFGGQASGYIGKDEIINAVAECNGWMLTGKGWTKAEWLEKKRDIFDSECMKNLVYAVITQTVKDYRAIIRRMQSGMRFAPGEYKSTVGEMHLIRRWFQKGDYLKIFEDTVSGEERLRMIDKEMGVTEEWIKMITSKLPLK